MLTALCDLTGHELGVRLRSGEVTATEAKDPADASLVFVTKYGESWAKDVADSPVTKETRKLLNHLGINGHRNFYTLRHTFRTVADETRSRGDRRGRP